MKELKEILEKEIKESKENVSIIVKDIQKLERIYSYNSELKLISASLIKVPIMMAVFDEVRKGNIKIDMPILLKKKDILQDTEVFEKGESYYLLEELVNWMIIKSDNTATNAIINYFSIDLINKYIRNTLKLKSTYLERLMLDKNAIEKGYNNYTSQEDMLNIFTRLFNKEILTEQLCDKSIEILYNQRCQNQVMRYIYEPVKYAHKTGALNSLNHDVGIMNIKDKLFYIGISVYGSKHDNGNRQLVGRLGKLIYDYLCKI